MVLAACSNAPKRWASVEALVHANSQVALAYSLKQLRTWLARGGMALGMPPHQKTVMCFRSDCLCSVLLLSAQWRSLAFAHRVPLYHLMTRNRARTNCLQLQGPFQPCNNMEYMCGLEQSTLGATVPQSLAADVMHACADDSGRPITAQSERPALAGRERPGRAHDAAIPIPDPPWRPLHAAGAGALHALRGRGAAADGAAARGASAAAQGPLMLCTLLERSKSEVCIARKQACIAFMDVHTCTMMRDDVGLAASPLP